MRRIALHRCIVVALGFAACASNATVPVGGACSLDDACSTGICFHDTDASGKSTPWTNGYCSGNCADAPCPEGICLALADSNSYCVSTCTADSDCRAGYVCAQAVSACLPDCRKGWSCGSTLTCNPANGKCEVALAFETSFFVHLPSRETTYALPIGVGQSVRR